MCKISNCKLMPKARGYCQRHFNEQFIAPIEKELANSKQIVARLENDLRALRDELIYAEPIVEEWAPIRDHRDKRVCQKCGRIFTFSSETFVHEIKCNGRSARKEPAVRQPRLPADRGVIVDNDSLDGLI